MWDTWTASKAMHCRPSSYLGLSDPMVCYYFDKAVYHFGSLVDADLNEAENTKGKKVSDKTIAGRKQNVLNKWMPPPASPDGSPARGRFKDPAVGKF